jgi:hypothetical protein
VIKTLRAITVVSFLALLVACGGGGGTRQDGALAPAPGTGRAAAAATAGCAAPAGLARLAPVDGSYFGVSLDWEHDSAAAYAKRLGRKPAVYVQFVPFPVDADARGYLGQAVDAIAEHGGSLLLTLEPHSGLGAVTKDSAEDLARLVAGYNQRGVATFVRFAHEMNGSWYPWSQDPAAYVAAFGTVAEALHRLAPAAATVWAPNYGGGYPFTGGRFTAQPGTDAYRTLDTDGDGTVTMSDDAYSPYWPGDDAVDWVGMSIYHWGTAYPWGENEQPEAGKFVDLLTGDYHGGGGDERAVPDFYAVYGDGHNKPVAVTETGAFYAPGRGGAAEDAIKVTWWKQVTDPDVARRFPRVQMINWFEWDKAESEIGGRVDWTITRSPGQAAAIAADLPGTWRFGGDDPCQPVQP